jgi:8-oxo-dGTP pyrophosphatase MutT (NUDIX family)
MNENALFPTTEITSLAQGNQEAIQIRKAQRCRLAAFTAVFSPDLENVLLVQLGDYARSNYGGNPWTLPGGSVDPSEIPSESACREVKEEVGLEIVETDLILAGWFSRPYTSRDGLDGEIVLLFAAKNSSENASLKCKPPETLAADFFAFSKDEWMEVSPTGQGRHPLQPLRRHWINWVEIAHSALSDNPNLKLWNYPTGETMALPIL